MEWVGVKTTPVSKANWLKKIEGKIKVLTEYKMSEILKSRNDITLKKENTHLRKKLSYNRITQIIIDVWLSTKLSELSSIKLYANM